MTLEKMATAVADSCASAGACGAGCGCRGEAPAASSGTLLALRPPADGKYPVIKQVRIAISYQCNLRCVHCYVPEVSRQQYHKMFPNELTIEEIETVIDRMSADFGVRRISITGGEALMTPVWPRTERIMRRAIDNDLIVRVITGGAAQTPISTVLKAARNSDNLIMQVSLDGVQSTTVNKMRGRSYAFSRAIETIKEIADSGTPVRVRYTVIEDNIDQTLDCYDLATELGASHFVFKSVLSLGEARENLNAVTPERVRELQLAAAQRSVGRRTKLQLPQPCYITDEDLPPGANTAISYCSCGRDNMYLTPDGDVYPCTYMAGMPGMENWRLGNLRDPDFNLAEAWLADDAFEEFRSAPTACHCTAQELSRQADEIMACHT